MGETQINTQSADFQKGVEVGMKINTIVGDDPVEESFSPKDLNADEYAIYMQGYEAGYDAANRPDTGNSDGALVGQCEFDFDSENSSCPDPYDDVWSIPDGDYDEGFDEGYVAGFEAARSKAKAEN